MAGRAHNSLRSARHALGVVVTILVAQGGCSCSADDAPTITTAELVATAERRFEPISREEELFAELLAGEASQDAIAAFVDAAYTPGIVFDDVSFGAYDEGRERVADMYGTFLLYFADAEVSWKPTLVGAETAVSIVTFSGMALGSAEFTADAPLVEVDLVTVDDDQVAEVTLFYERAALERMLPGRAPAGTPEAYVEAWNSRQTDLITELYTVDATRLDDLDPAAEPQPITDSIERFSRALDGATLRLDLAFAQAGGDRAGAIFTVTSDECSTELAMVWTYGDAGMITHELVHYMPSTVTTCPWAG